MSYVVKRVEDAIPEEIPCGILRGLTLSKDFKDMDFAHVTITDQTKRHYHKTLTEVYYVLNGAIDVDVDGNIEHLEKGSLIMIHPNTKHKAWKKSEEDAEILVICSPPWTEDDEIMVE